MPRITFLDNSFIDVKVGANLMQSIILAERPIGNSCDAIGICGKCFVQVVKGMENLSKPNPIEQRLMLRERLAPGIRISCQVKVMGDVVITTSYW